MKDKIIEILRANTRPIANMPPLAWEEHMEKAANSIMDLPISKEECANYARSKAVTDGEIEAEIIRTTDNYPEGAEAYGFRKAIKWMREQQGEGWISVEDDLPKDEKMVIAHDGKNVFAAEYDPNNSCGEYAPSKWYDCEAECFIAQDHDHHVTHWMPLPNPPKGLTDKQ